VLNLSSDPERRVDIEWGDDDARRFLVRIVMEGSDRHGLFADIAKAVSDTGTNIQSADIEAVEGGMRGQFVVEVENLSHLKKVMRRVQRVKGVLSVERKESVGESDLRLG
jgi:GTP pyrophosphokinase